MVAKRFNQNLGIDFKETFSLEIKPSIIQIILSIAISHRWVLWQINIDNAFLNETLQESVYMEQLVGFVDSNKSNYVCKLHESIYGLKQAPRRWYDQLRQTFSSWGFTRSRMGPSLFTLYTNKKVIWVLIYVDDIVVTRNNIVLIARIIQQFHIKFSLKDLGPLTFILGLEAYRNKSGLYLSQKKYVNYLLVKINMLE